jgi:hypothetical protein
MTAQDFEQTDGELAFATPGDWFPIRVPRRRADATELTRQILAARPDLAARREAVERMAAGLVEACASLDVLCAYTTALDVPRGPLPATVLASAYPLGGLSVFQLAERIAAGDGSTPAPDSMFAPEVESFDLPAGQTARIERLQEWDSPAGDQRIVFLVVQYIARIPGADTAILLTFATPAMGLARQLRQLFHQMACTLRFTYAEPER